MINVYAWPPVGVVGRSWAVVQPVAGLRSALTGKDQRQSSQRARRHVALTVSALANTVHGGGYMEMLGQLLQGGVHAVRLTSWSPNWHLDQPEQYQWLSIGLTATASTSGGMAAWRVAGLPPGYPLTRPGDRVTVAGVVWQSVNAATADASGVAYIRVMGSPTGSGTLLLDRQETAAFRVEPGQIPTGMQAPGKGWSYSWQFREVFADEVGGFTEVNPWI